MEILNKKAKFDYLIYDTLEAGIVLTGTEIKSIRNGSCNLKDSYILIKNNEAFILNMHISNYDKGSIFNTEETRIRKLLLHKNEILKLKDKISIKGFAIVPLKLYFKDGIAKIEIGVAKGKHTYDKKESIKERDIKRETDKMLKNRY
ncbi:MAG: SsrA-binding protein SmpB [Bacilli bacterium]|nr:SsrA-binding protein SmpB [Bacilli bacterium]